MNNFRHRILFLLVIGLFVLVACGTAVSQSEPEANNDSVGSTTAFPTNTSQPEPTDKPTNEPAPTVVEAEPELEAETEPVTGEAMAEDSVETANGKPILTEPRVQSETYSRDQKKECELSIVPHSSC